MAVQACIGPLRLRNLVVLQGQSEEEREEDRLGVRDSETANSRWNAGAKAMLQSYMRHLPGSVVRRWPPRSDWPVLLALKCKEPPPHLEMRHIITMIFQITKSFSA
jgi:hypothetical protein